MTVFRLALLGFGNVGKALLRLLVIKRHELKQLYGIDFIITGIATLHHGCTIDPDGIPPAEALSANDLGVLSKLPSTLNAFKFIQQCPADVLFETTPVNYSTGQPAVDYITAGIQSGMHVITANKGPVVHAYRRLKQLAAQNGVKFLFESTVMDGAPIFSLFRETLPAAQLLSFRGVLNSTTNLMLTKMEEGMDFEQAVAFCQQVGIAETNPRGDIDGWDAAVKVAALVTVLMDYPLVPAEVERQGIAHLKPEDLQQARSQGKRWKLVCSARRTAKGVDARVAPEMVGGESPLFQVEGTSSLVEFETDVLGVLSIKETDPGPETTAYGMLADMIRALDRI